MAFLWRLASSAGGAGGLVGGAGVAIAAAGAGVLVVQSSMPVAVFNYLYALRGNRSPDQVASLVLCSTLLSFAFIPLLLTWWLPALR